MLICHQICTQLSILISLIVGKKNFDVKIAEENENKKSHSQSAGNRAACYRK